MEKIPSWMERLLLPKLNEISGELKAIPTRIDAVATGIVSLRNETKTEIASLRNEMLAKFEAADTRVASLRTELKSDFASFSVGDDLADHGIVIGWYAVTVVNMGLYAHTRPPGCMKTFNQAGGRHECFRIFCVDPALNGMSPDLYILLSVRQRIPGCNEYLLTNQV